MPVNFQKIINYSRALGYTVPSYNRAGVVTFAANTLLPNCYFGEYDSSNQSFITVNPSSINRNIQTNPVIVILAESPHKYEYTYQNGVVTPRVPLFKSRSKINKYLKNYLPATTAGRYDVYLVNAIQYQCSFGLNLKYYRQQKNNVFALTWNMEPALNDLICELKNLIQSDQDIILNCCTKELRKFLCMTEIFKLYFPQSNISEAPHPSTWK